MFSTNDAGTTGYIHTYTHTQNEKLYHILNYIEILTLNDNKPNIKTKL